MQQLGLRCAERLVGLCRRRDAHPANERLQRLLVRLLRGDATRLLLRLLQVQLRLLRGRVRQGRSNSRSRSREGVSPGLQRARPARDGLQRLRLRLQLLQMRRLRLKLLRLLLRLRLRLGVVRQRLHPRLSWLRLREPRALGLQPDRPRRSGQRAEHGRGDKRGHLKWREARRSGLVGGRGADGCCGGGSYWPRATAAAAAARQRARYCGRHANSGGSTTSEGRASEAVKPHWLRCGGGGREGGCRPQLLRPRAGAQRVWLRPAHAHRCTRLPRRARHKWPRPKRARHRLQTTLRQPRGRPWSVCRLAAQLGRL